jgi:myo-inositol-1(or 4)-monophosphatase
LQPTLNDLEILARQAGVILKDGYGRRLQVKYKGEIDLVTEYDHLSEEFLIGEIQRRFPVHQIVSEERGKIAGSECCRWYIDPIDGTVNFAHGVPMFCVTLAYEKGGQVRLGVVYDPLRDECFSAERGLGARLNGQLIEPSGEQCLERALLVTGFGYDIRTNPRNNLDEFVRFSLCSQGVRRLGSAALDLCYIACGRLDGFWELAIKPWDIAGGGLIAAEAGARVTDIRGGPDYLQPPCSILAATPAVHGQMLEVLGRGDS